MLKFLLLGSVLLTSTLAADSKADLEFTMLPGTPTLQRPGSPDIPRHSYEHNTYERLNSAFFKSNEEVKKLNDRLENAEKQILTLEGLVACSNANPPFYKKIIPADKILATSFIFAAISFYEMYAFSGSTVLAMGTFMSTMYSCYCFLKLTRNAASVAGNSQIMSRIG
ncbi:hypothetical protein [Candidatus Odyssella thessalonicensis]|uniref:hypothetical protein n=1 Tax=Candidatus Odyssella thessalonicensis TaxID=84647 RepID=UPI000225C09A|nr:hypothetical protein [Candidatus Odyssella thessalonicensis]